MKNNSLEKFRKLTAYLNILVTLIMATLIALLFLVYLPQIKSFGENIPNDESLGYGIATAISIVVWAINAVFFAIISLLNIILAVLLFTNKIKVKGFKAFLIILALLHFAGSFFGIISSLMIKQVTFYLGIVLSAFIAIYGIYQFIVAILVKNNGQLLNEDLNQTKTNTEDPLN